VLWWGLIAPVGTPDAIIATLQNVFIEAANSDKFKSVMDKQGATLNVQDGAATGALIRTELEALGEVARSLGIEKKTQ
jgi:tripartite-type tricarboxylate transporter receptor subunit TctC